MAGLAVAVVLALTACGGSSSNQASAPTAVTRCNVTLATITPLMAAVGGAGSVTVSVSRECAWQALSNADWLWFTSPASGQGDATITFAVAANHVVAQRQAVVTVNESRLDIRQAAAFCTYAIGSAGHTFPASGGVDRVAVDARDGCVWTVQSSAPWLIFDTTQSQGQGSVGVTAGTNAGAARSATVFIAGLAWVATQGAAGTGAGSTVTIVAQPVPGAWLTDRGGPTGTAFSSGSANVPD